MEVAEHERPLEHDPLVERRDADDRLQPGRDTATAGRTSPRTRTAGSSPCSRSRSRRTNACRWWPRARRPRSRSRSAPRRAARAPPTTSAGRRRANIVDEERGRVDRAAQQRPRDLADRDVARRERRREHRVVGVRVLHLDEEVERRVEQRPVHRRDREQARRDERAVRDELAADLRGRRRACRRRCRSRAGRTTARRTRSGRCTRCAGTRGRCVRRAATAAGASAANGTAQRRRRSGRGHELNRLVNVRTPNQRADRDARDEDRDVHGDRRRRRSARSSPRARARRRATAARAPRAAAARSGAG